MGNNIGQIEILDERIFTLSRSLQSIKSARADIAEKKFSDQTLKALRALDEAIGRLASEIRWLEEEHIRLVIDDADAANLAAQAERERQADPLAWLDRHIAAQGKQGELVAEVARVTETLTPEELDQVEREKRSGRIRILRFPGDGKPQTEQQLTPRGWTLVEGDR